MRVELAAAAAAATFVASASKANAGDSVQLPHRNMRDYLPRRSNNNEQQPPVWKAHNANAVIRNNPESSSSNNNNIHVEPDVGILSSTGIDIVSQQPRHLQSIQDGFGASVVNTNTTDIVDLCELMNVENNTVCDCSEWNVLRGSFECQLYDDDANSYCFDDYLANNVCGNVTFGVLSDGTNVSMNYCMFTKTPAEHVYCTKHFLSSDGLVSSAGDLTGAAGNCSMSIDGTECNACMIQTDCIQADGRNYPGPGPFDCSNTAAGTSGNQCKNDVAFPLLEPDAPINLGGDSYSESPTMASSGNDDNDSAVGVETDGAATERSSSKRFMRCSILFAAATSVVALLAAE